MRRLDVGSLAGEFEVLVVGLQRLLLGDVALVDHGLENFELARLGSLQVVQRVVG